MIAVLSILITVSIRLDLWRTSLDAAIEVMKYREQSVALKVTLLWQKVEDANLFSKGEHPQFRWSQRWNKMEIVDRDSSE